MIKINLGVYSEKAETVLRETFESGVIYREPNGELFAELNDENLTKDYIIAELKKFSHVAMHKNLYNDCIELIEVLQRKKTQSYIIGQQLDPFTVERIGILIDEISSITSETNEKIRKLVFERNEKTDKLRKELSELWSKTG